VADATGLSDRQLQAIAAHYQQETGFVLTGEDGRLRLRFFVPRHEMAMCVHATVAATTVLVAAGTVTGSQLIASTASGDCRISWTGGDRPAVTVEQQAPWLGPPVLAATELGAALGLPASAIGQPIRPVSVSRPKLIVPLDRAGDLHRAVPDLPELWRLCRAYKCTGAYLFAPHPDGRPDHVVARQFPVDAGFAEDPATGVAAGALAAYLADLAGHREPGWLQVDIDQGQAMGRPSRLRARALTDGASVLRSMVSGQAVLRATEQLALADLPDIDEPGGLR
ncbi:MAG: PhzF family phenazine biosynthesis isomerase, partial [Jatrophihabitantaceae bacterium]